MYEVETIEIDEDNRLVVYVDDCTDSPLDWGWDVEMHDIDDYRMWRGWEQPEDALANFAREMHCRFGMAGQPEKRDRAIHLYKVLIGDTREFKVHEWRGYSQSDWATVLEIGENIGLYTAYAAWRRGDVFLVVHEKREQWTNADETAEMDTWEPVDSLGGCYLDDNYTALDVARDHFDVDLDK